MKLPRKPTVLQRKTYPLFMVNLACFPFFFLFIQSLLENAPHIYHCLFTRTSATLLQTYLTYNWTMVTISLPLQHISPPVHPRHSSRILFNPLVLCPIISAVYSTSSLPLLPSFCAQAGFFAVLDKPLCSVLPHYLTNDSTSN